MEPKRQLIRSTSPFKGPWELNGKVPAGAGIRAFIVLIGELSKEIMMVLSTISFRTPASPETRYAQPLFIVGCCSNRPISQERWGTEPVGYLTGPGQNVVSLSMFKNMTFTENARLQLGCSAANVWGGRAGRSVSVFQAVRISGT